MTFMLDSLGGPQVQPQQQLQQQQAVAGAAPREFLIDDPLHFSVLEVSAKSQLQQQAQYLAALTGKFGMGLEEQKRKVEAGYVSLNDNYTACSSVYGGGAGSPAAIEAGKASTSSAAGSGSGSGFGSGFGSGSASSTAGSDALSGDVRPAKIGRMVTATATAATASLGGKATTVSS